MNKKGFTGIEIALVVGVIGLMIGLFAPKTVASVGDIFNGGNKNQTKQIHKIDLKYTMGYLDEKGKFIKVGDYSKKEDMQNVVAQQAPEKWSTKVKIIIGFIVVLAIAFPSAAVKIILQLKKNTVQIVTGLEEAKKQLPPESVAIIDTNLSKKMDTQAKTSVKKIKVKL